MNSTNAILFLQAHVIVADVMGSVAAVANWSAIAFPLLIGSARPVWAATWVSVVVAFSVSHSSTIGFSTSWWSTGFLSAFSHPFAFQPAAHTVTQLIEY